MKFFQIFKEQDGQWSARRVMCFLSLLAAFYLSIVALTSNPATWHWFLPAISFLAVSVLMLLFTTWADIKEVLAAAKGK